MMTPRRYRLCQAPALGLLMWALDQCGFPPLFDDVAIDLVRSGAEASLPVTVAIGLDYQLELRTEFASVDARVSDEVIGGYVDGHCEASDPPPGSIAGRASKGVPIRFRVRAVDQSTRGLVVDRVFESRCSFAHAGKYKMRRIAKLTLAPGTYTFTVTAVDGEPELAGTRNYLVLSPPRTK